MYFSLTAIIILSSWIAEIYGLNVILPQTGELVYIQSLISPEGIRWLLRHIVTNYTNFAPLGMVIVAMFGISVAQHSGFIDALFRHTVHPSDRKRVIWIVIVLGLLSNAIGDAGYIILLPISAMLFRYINLHPIIGIITAYVSVACGYSANILLSTMDPLISRITDDAIINHNRGADIIGQMSNYYFMAVSTILIAFIIYFVTTKSLLPQLNQYSVEAVSDRLLSKKEKRAVNIAMIVGAVYFFIIIFSTFSSYGILRGVSGNLMRSPFIMGVLFLLSFGIGLIGVVYGFSSGKYRSDIDISNGLSQSMRLMGNYLVIAFFASQMFACMEYTHLDKYIAIGGANLFIMFDYSPLGGLILFTLFAACLNLFMVSALFKWNLLAFIFIPLFENIGVTADYVQCAFRIGDSSTNAITPFLFYMPLVLAYIQQYKINTTYFTLVKYTWRYVIFILAAWILLFVLWYVTRLPLGL